MKVLYPAALIFVPMPVMLRGIAAKPETGSSGLWMSGAAFSGFCARDPGQREQTLCKEAQRCGTHDVERVAAGLDAGARRAAVLVDVLPVHLDALLDLCGSAFQAVGQQRELPLRLGGMYQLVHVGRLDVGVGRALARAHVDAVPAGVGPPVVVEEDHHDLAAAETRGELDGAVPG